MVALGIFLLISLVLQLPVILCGLSIGLLILACGAALRSPKVLKLGWNILIAYDQAANAATGGDEDETISSRTGKLRNSRPWARALSAFLDIFQKDHTKKSVEPDEGKDKLVE